MNKQRPLLLIILLLYIFTPNMLQWVTDPTGNWYRPFLIWLLVIIAAFAIQRLSRAHDI